MGRRRRYIKSKQIYELCFRARRGLPLRPLDVICVLVESIIARVQQDEKVEIIAFLWMSNHPHIVVRVKDAGEAARFYGQIKKQLTEALKKLLGRSHLTIWEEGGTTVNLLPDIEAVLDKIAYVYLNPSEAHLESSVERYPHLHTWQQFLDAPDDVDAEMVKDCPWIRQPMIPKLPSRSLTRRQDEFYALKMKKAARESHKLIIRPNAWMKTFFEDDPLTPEDIRALNQSIIDSVRAREAELTVERQKAGTRVLGATRLRQESIFKEHTPRKNEEKIFVQTRDKELRIAIIEEIKEIDALCKECYQRYKLGDYSVQWPPGTFRPPLPPLANSLV